MVPKIHLVYPKYKNMIYAHTEMKNYTGYIPEQL